MSEGKVKLQRYGGSLFGSTAHKLPLVGFFETEIEHKDRAGKIKVVVSESENFLAGVDTLDLIFPGWRNAFQVNNVDSNLNKVEDEETVEFMLKHRFREVFDGNLEYSMKGAEVELLVKEGAKPIFKRAYSIPYGIRERVERILLEAEEENILVRIERSTGWASPIVVVTPEEMLSVLVGFLEMVEDRNLKANWGKCKFLVKEVKYLGHVLSQNGLRISGDKVKAILEAPAPRNVSELRSFVGLVDYCSRFLANLNTKMAPLFELLKKRELWSGTDTHERVFIDLKRKLCSAPVLEHFDPRKPIILVTDASDKGLGGSLCHVIDDVEKPVLFVSRTLTASEKNYPILHREAWALVFTMEKCYKYLVGVEFVAYTDHQPLMGIFGASNELDATVVNRLQRYGIRLSVFDFGLKYGPGKKNGLADCLSRLPISESPSEEDSSEEGISEINAVMYGDQAVSFNFETIAKFTREDPLLDKVKLWVQHGWPKSVPTEFRIFAGKKESLSLGREVLLLNGRVVIPEKLKVGAEVEKSCKKMLERFGKGDIDLLVKEFLKCQRFNPTASGKVPAREILKCEPQTYWVKLTKACSKGNETSTASQVMQVRNRLVEYLPGEEAWYEVVGNEMAKRIPCKIVQKIGQVMYLIQGGMNTKVAHTDQLGKRGKSFVGVEKGNLLSPKEIHTETIPETMQPAVTQSPVARPSDLSASSTPEGTPTPVGTPTPRPVRQRRPPVRFQPDDFRK